ncbi:TIGR02302 family protein [Lentilitoribacter sp. EG35]|uniref:TIGR02302 family protein n=1 Tax=Lentilitoribacter sp. EG35 TaxID=3234192 RepID=UPI00346154A2
MDKDQGRAKQSILKHRSLSRVTIFAERLWSVLLFPLCIMGLFIAISWFGFFRSIPFWANIAILVVFAISLIYALLPFTKLRLPTIAEADQRLEEDNQIPHQGLAVHNQELSQDDHGSLVLWKEHQRRMLKKLENLRQGSLRTNTDSRDPYGFRALVLLLLATGFSYSFSGQSGTVLDAFSKPKNLVNQADLVRVDAWIKPPSYVNQAPIFLKNLPSDQPIAIPENSQIVVRLAGAIEDIKTPEFILKGGSKLAFNESLDRQNPNARSYIFTPVNDGELRISNAQKWQLNLVRDTPPNIAFSRFPEKALNGALELSYFATDDHGVASAKAIIEPLYPADDHALPLYDSPEFDLQLPRRNSDDGLASTSYDLTDHPLAGEEAIITLIVTDHTGQESRAEGVEVILPERQFVSPLAKSMLEQRKVLAFDAYELPRAIVLNDALTALPEETIPNIRDYLLIKSAREGMSLAYSDEDLLRWVDDLWSIALLLEDGDLSLAEQRLKNAQKALSEALEQGASEEEIAQLMDELREAMDDYLQQLAQSDNVNPPQQNQQQNALELEAQDLTDMLDQIEEMAKSGNREQAQRMLNDLQNMMNNMQANRQQQPQSGEQSQTEQQLNELGEILREQQRLLDQTYQQQQQTENQQGQENTTPSPEGGERQELSEQELADALQKLEEQQQALQERLQQLQKQMEEQGLDPAEGLGEAADAMGNAAGELNNGQTGQAGEEQGRAIQALREGAQQMLDQLQQQMQAQQGQGQGQQGNQPQGRQGNGQGRDPLGRRSGGDREGIYGRNPNGNFDDAANVQRAREILEIIRKRLGENFRLEFEKNYLERLLKTPQ